MKVKNIAVINGNTTTTVINYDVEGEEKAFYVNNSADTASAASAFVALYNAGLL